MEKWKQKAVTVIDRLTCSKTERGFEGHIVALAAEWMTQSGQVRRF